jgi:ATP-dependent Zn protease
MIPDKHLDLGQLLGKAVHRERFPTEQMCNDILAIIMAGRASEEIVFGDVSVFGSGVPESDLAVATTIAKDLEMRAGFGEAGVIYLGGKEDWLHVPATTIASVRRRIEAALARASALLQDNVDELESARVLDGRIDSSFIRMLN